MLERGGHEIISSDEAAGRIDTKHVLFHVIEQGAPVHFGRLDEVFSDALKANKNYVIFGPNLSVEAADSIAELRLRLMCARYHRRHALGTKIALATTEIALKRAITELTKVNMVWQTLQASINLAFSC